MMRGCFCLLLALAAASASAEESAISRTQAAQIAQQKFGGKVISVDEVDSTPVINEDENPQAPSSQNNARFVVKLMQSGRVHVVNLDAQGQQLNPAP
jgi:nitrous oxide reductase accessory protein NosL